MLNQYTAIIEKDENWFISYCPEFPGANGQGHTKTECLESLSSAINLIIEVRKEEAFKSISENAFQERLKKNSQHKYQC